MRICLVTPFAWSQPHDVNEHVAASRSSCGALGHEVTVLAPSTRAADLLAGRRALQRGESADVIAVGPAVPISRRSQMGVPVGVQANLSLALQQGRFDVVHGFEPGLPSLSYLALRDSDALGRRDVRLAEPARLSRRPARSARSCSARLDALIALTEPARAAAEQRFPGDYRLLSPGVDTTLFAPAAKTSTIVVELRPNERVIARGVLDELHDLPGWEVVLLRTRPLIARPTIPRALARRVHLRTARDGAVARRAAERGGDLRARASTAWRASASRRPQPAARSPSRRAASSQPELAAAAAARLAEHEDVRVREGAKARAEAEPQTFAAVAAELAELYSGLAGRRRPPRRAEPLADRPWIVADLHMHTSWSHDCAVDAGELVDHAIGRRARRDRRHRPQRLRRRARGGRLRARAAT